MSKKKRRRRTNAMRMLDVQQVDYEVLSFSSDIHSAEGVAAALDLDPRTVYKTLVIERARGKPLLVMVPGDEHVDLGALAASVGEKKLSMASHHDAERLTGLQVGGISALALLNKGFEICIAEAAREIEQIAVSAGERGLNLRLAMADVVRVTDARWVRVRGEGD